MRIGIDGYNLALVDGTGVATYAASLARILRDAGHELTGLFGIPVGKQRELREILFFDRLQRPSATPKAKGVHQRLGALKPFVQQEARDVPLTDLVEKSAFADRLPEFDRIVTVGHLFEHAHAHFHSFGRFAVVRMHNPPEIMHWTYPVPVKLAGAKNVYTLHDMVPLRLPYTTLDIKRSYYRLIAKCVEEADHLCTVSEASRNDLLARFEIPQDRLSVTYQAAPLPADITHSDRAEDEAMIEGIFGLKPRGYFLYFGAIEPKKNVGRLIEAYLTTRTQTPLVIVGAKSWESERELKLLGGKQGATPTRLADRVIQLDYLPRSLLMRLVRGAKAVAFPSLYEGFGLPVHEAMLLGTPVLTTCTSSLPEVAGDAALLVNPYDVNAIAAGLARLDADEGLRMELSARGLVQAARFSQDRYLEKMTAVYDGLLREKRPSALPGGNGSGRLQPPLPE